MSFDNYQEKKKFYMNEEEVMKMDVIEDEIYNLSGEYGLEGHDVAFIYLIKELKDLNDSIKDLNEQIEYYIDYKYRELD